jgi:hypothetical protein
MRKPNSSARRTIWIAFADRFLLLLHGSVHVAQAAGAGRILDLAGAAPGPDFGGDLRRDRALSSRRELVTHVCAREAEAIAERDGILAFLEAHPDGNVTFRDRASVLAVVDDLARGRAAEPSLDREH